MSTGLIPPRLQQRATPNFSTHCSSVSRLLKHYADGTAPVGSPRAAALGTLRLSLLGRVRRASFLPSGCALLMAPALASTAALPAVGDPLSALLPLGEESQSSRLSQPLALEPRPLPQSLHALDVGLSGESAESRPVFAGYRDALGAVLRAISASDCGGGADATSTFAVDGRGALLAPASDSDRAGCADGELEAAGCSAPSQRKARRTAAPQHCSVLPDPPASAGPGGPLASLLPIDEWEGEGSLGSPHDGGGVASPLRGFGTARSLEGSGGGLSLVTPLDAGGELPLQGLSGPADEGVDWHGAPASLWDSIPAW